MISELVGVTIVDKTTLLKFSDVMCLKQADTFSAGGFIKQSMFIHLEFSN
ncbi:hypothetical protein LB941_11070 [Ligilactobacillus sp. WILCCON 0076]|uniref:Uncharacterized protein n=1 Tax=Ligilactobacillus ubinensis TaxID=2876789 RepID=A0A9X2FM63_9LACO|nr:hypothetical protein [Ligilactobacillus ubinensis]MCP0887870.1 hypothetical protein [Ligilactobacillus ubinensis]